MCGKNNWCVFDVRFFFFKKKLLDSRQLKPSLVRDVGENTNKKIFWGGDWCGHWLPWQLPNCMGDLDKDWNHRNYEWGGGQGWFLLSSVFNSDTQELMLVINQASCCHTGQDNYWRVQHLGGSSWYDWLFLLVSLRPSRDQRCDSVSRTNRAHPGAGRWFQYHAAIYVVFITYN